MTTPPPFGVEGRGASTRLSAAEYGASRSALWTGASVLITDTHGRILVQSVDYRTTRLLPGGAVDAFEAPSHAAAREVREELGVTATYAEGLAVDWVPSTKPGMDPAMRFPGEIIYVYDGGTWSDEQIAAIQLPEQEITAVHLVEPADLPQYMDPGDARRALAALRARINRSGTVLLEDGHPIAPTVLDHLHLFSTPRPAQNWQWRSEPVTPGLPIQQTAYWLFAPDGRALVLIEPGTGVPHLPDASEPGSQMPGAMELRRTVQEAARATISEPQYLGYLYDDTAPCAHVRMAAVMTQHHSPADPTETAPRPARILATPEQVSALFAWGPDGPRQLDAVHTMRQDLHLPRPIQQPFTLLDPSGQSACPKPK